MKSQKTTSKIRPWYDRIFDRVELVNTNPRLAPYLDVDKFSQYQTNVMLKLIGQGLPLTPPKELKAITPEKLGLLLGQQCATIYALGECFQGLDDPEIMEQAKKAAKDLRKQRHVPGVKSVLHAANVGGMMIEQLVNHFPKFEKNLHAAFKAALDQPNYQEAVEFFRGFAKGITKPALKDGQIAGRTTATTLQMKMFMHAEQAAKMKSVRQLRAFLLENGLTEGTLGDEERLQKLCTRLGYAPGRKQSRSHQKE